MIQDFISKQVATVPRSLEMKKRVGHRSRDVVTPQVACWRLLSLTVLFGDWLPSIVIAHLQVVSSQIAPNHDYEVNQVQDIRMHI